MQKYTCRYGNSKDRIIRNFLIIACTSKMAKGKIIRKGAEVTVTDLKKVMVLLICFVVLHFLYRPPVAAVINNCQPLVYTFTLSFIPD